MVFVVVHRRFDNSIQQNKTAVKRIFMSLTAALFRFQRIYQPNNIEMTLIELRTILLCAGACFLFIT